MKIFLNERMIKAFLGHYELFVLFSVSFVNPSKRARAFIWRPVCLWAGEIFYRHSEENYYNLQGNRNLSTFRN